MWSKTSIEAREYARSEIPGRELPAPTRGVDGFIRTNSVAIGLGESLTKDEQLSECSGSTFPVLQIRLSCTYTSSLRRHGRGPEDCERVGRGERWWRGAGLGWPSSRYDKDACADSTEYVPSFVHVAGKGV